MHVAVALIQGSSSALNLLEASKTTALPGAYPGFRAGGC